MDRRTFLMSASLGLLLTATASFARDFPDATLDLMSAPPATHTTASKLVTGDDGRTYQIFTAVPVEAAPDSGYPVLYMLDGNAVFSRLTGEMLGQTPGLMIVAIGYDTESTFETNQRALDYTPPPVGQSGPVPDAQRQGRQVGGAAAFLDRLIGPLREAAEEGVAVDPSRRGIWGHSYGGLFSLYALFNQPEAFSTYIPVSPSVGFGDGALLAMEERAPITDQTKSVLIMLGDMESRSGTPALIEPRPSPQTIALIERLEQRNDLSVDSRVLEGLQHGATFAASFPYALPLAAGINP